jgi:hypothetical protein
MLSIHMMFGRLVAKVKELTLRKSQMDFIFWVGRGVQFFLYGSLSTYLVLPCY